MNDEEETFSIQLSQYLSNIIKHAIISKNAALKVGMHVKIKESFLQFNRDL